MYESCLLSMYESLNFAWNFSVTTSQVACLIWRKYELYQCFMQKSKTFHEFEFNTNATTYIFVDLYFKFLFFFYYCYQEM